MARVVRLGTNSHEDRRTLRGNSPNNGRVTWAAPYASCGIRWRPALKKADNEYHDCNDEKNMDQTSSDAESKPQSPHQQ